MEDEMKVHTILAAAIASVLGLVGCQELFDKDTSQVKAQIGATVAETSKAYEDFPKTLDRFSILKHYTTDYTGVKDGAPETIKNLENFFDDLAEQIKLGDPIGTSYKITDLKIEALTDRLAWMTYQDETKWGRSGAILWDIKMRCTTLIRKEGGNWRVFHEHCSTVSG
jgi:ketosteroid isomerase-like protein